MTCSTGSSGPSRCGLCGVPRGEPPGEGATQYASQSGAGILNHSVKLPTHRAERTANELWITGETISGSGVCGLWLCGTTLRPGSGDSGDLQRKSATIHSSTNAAIRAVDSRAGHRRRPCAKRPASRYLRRSSPLSNQGRRSEMPTS